jgi:hypothetical protein
MWSAVTKYAMIIDRTHSQALQGVRDFLKDAQPAAGEDELDDLAVAEMEHQMLSDSDSYIVKSLLFFLLVSFNEFALKRIYSLYQPPEAAPPKRGAVQFIVTALKRLEAIKEVPISYKANFEKHIDPVRNGFTHGEWEEIGEALGTVDLTQSFLSVAEYFGAIQENLRVQGFDV